MLHCTANQANPKLTGKDIADYHMKPVAQGGRGWDRPGYSLVIRTDGTIDNLVKYNEDAWVQANEITYGAAGFNGVSRHVSYIGGIDAQGAPKDTRTPAQKEVLAGIVKRAIAAHPDIKVLGHRQVNPGKACPSFDVPYFLRSIGVAEKNIYSG